MKLTHGKGVADFTMTQLYYLCDLTSLGLSLSIERTF